MSWQFKLDEWTVRLSALGFRNRLYFRDGVVSRPVSDHVAAARPAEVSFAETPGFYTVPAETLAGRLEGAYRVERWLGPDYPVFIHHHGTNENPYDRSFKQIFLGMQEPLPANLLVVRAPFGGGLGEFLDGIATLNNYAAMVATSVAVIEGLIARCRELGARHIVLSGISLGGFVINLHRALLNTATEYRPLLAGAAMGSLFTDTAYRRLVDEDALAQAAQVRTVLNFEEAFAARPQDNVVPLLARHDAYVVFEQQRPVYGERVVNVLDKSHVTGALATGELRTHVLAGLATAEPV